ncbi:MAG: protein-L-isoaspartate O-methyltransferase [Rhodospirillaceae bacterium]|jgi:protein-L-isoaspartate(D-aspartate) O-methyltransferase|nr:protein-L-isoaspartate O-methyltransferase [Rhodospirillaceae bacterium]|tara:strand:- start:8142 stop:8792 length:651 start_codon:yes stop_codon:yes gene_type:complete
MDFAAARENMVDCQILPNRVTDQRLIGALSAIPREAFVPTEFKGVAYVDEAIPLSGGRYLMEPLITARLIQAAEPKTQDLALVVGCGTGYGAAVLSYLAGTVVAVESDGGLAKEANQILSGLGIDTVAVIEGHLENGYRKQAPYDVIFFDGAVADVPEAISSQLAEDGRLVAVISEDGVGKAMLMTRHHDQLSSREVFDAGTPPLPGFEPSESFVF